MKKTLLSILILTNLLYSNTVDNYISEIMDYKYNKVIPKNAEVLRIDHDQSPTKNGVMYIESFTNKMNNIDLSLGLSVFSERGETLKNYSPLAQFSLEHFMDKNFSLFGKIQYLTQSKVDLVQLLLGINYYLPKVVTSTDFYVGGAIGKGQMRWKSILNGNYKPKYSSTLFALSSGLIYDLANDFYLRIEVSIQKTDYRTIYSKLKYIALGTIGIGYQF